MILILGFGSRWEITEAVRNNAEKLRKPSAHFKHNQTTNLEAVLPKPMAFMYEIHIASQKIDILMLVPTFISMVLYYM
jgi:hypothetical protein